MEVNIIEIKDGESGRPIVVDAPSIVDAAKQKIEVTMKKKRRRGKSKRRLIKPSYSKIPWSDKRKYGVTKRNNRYRKIVLAKTHAPFNNNQFLMEIHKPEPENDFHLVRTPSARTRDSSFSVDSEDNYFFSLPEDEEEYLAKEFSSVYEDAQTERLSGMSKDDLIQEYLLLEAKYENLVKRTERKQRNIAEDERDVLDKDALSADKDNIVTDKDKSLTSPESSATEETEMIDILQRVKEQEEQIHELQLSNEKLRLENEHLRKRTQGSTSEDSESDSSSTSGSSSSTSSRSISPVAVEAAVTTNNLTNGNHNNHDQNGETEDMEFAYPLVNGFHDENDQE